MKSYHAFTKPLLRWLLLLFYPLAAIICSILVENGFFGKFNNGFHFSIAITLMASVMIAIEPVLDHWFLGGLHSKDANRLDFLKGSDKGKEIFGSAVVFDIMRRILTYTICSVAAIAIGVLCFKQVIQTEIIIICINYLLISYFFASLGVFLSRFSTNIWLNVGIAYLFSVFMTFGLVFIQSILTSVITTFVIAVLCVLISILIAWFAMKKFKESYYD